MKYFIYLLSIVVTPYNTFAQMDTVSNLSNTEKVYGLSLFWKEASYNFAYFDKTRINWDSTYQTYIPQVLNTKSTYEYYRVMQKFCALLKDGHTNVYFPANIKKGSMNLDVSFAHLDNKIFLTAIPKKDSSLVPLGSELIKINGISIDDFLTNEIFPYISYSAKHQLYNDAVHQILRPPLISDNKSVHLTFRTATGKIVTYETKSNTGNQKFATVPAEIKYNRFFTILPSGIAYVFFRDFRDTSVVLEFKKYLPDLYGAKGVILDLRYNHGGNSDVGIEILKYFTMQKLIKGSAWKTPSHMASYKAWGKFYTLKDTIDLNEKDKDWVKTSVKVFNKDYWFGEVAENYENNLTVPRIKAPLIVLIGNGTSSAAEDFLISLEDIKGRAITIGERTLGSTGQPLFLDLPGGGSARICTKRNTYPDGREFVGTGIKPDIEVKRKISDLLEGKDAVLEKALEILLNKK